MELGEVDGGAGCGAPVASLAISEEGELPFPAGVLERVGEVVHGAAEGVRGGVVVLAEPRVEGRAGPGHVAGRELAAGGRHHRVGRVVPLRHPPSLAYGRG